MRFDPQKVMVVIPLFNHAASVRKVAKGVLAVHEQLMVVDDGSTDDGAGAVAGLPLRLLRHRRNRGKGAALMTAAREALRLGMTHIITLDADGQHDPADIPRMLQTMAQNPHAVVVGKRNFNADEVPVASRLGRQFSNFWLRLQTGRSVGDTQSGFRGYPLVLFEALHFTEAKYSFEVEILVRSAWAGISLCELDISVYYPPGSTRD